MDKSEALLLVAEKALTEVRDVRADVAAIKNGPKAASSFVVNADGFLVVAFSDGRTENVGKVRGKDGKDGSTIQNASVAADGTLHLYLTDGREINVGGVRGERGADGRDGSAKDGAPGRDGRSIVSGRLDGGSLVLTFNDGSSEIVGNVVGPQGAKGADGRAVTSARVDESGALVLTFSDQTEIVVGTVRGADGDRGPSGPMGAYVASAVVDGGNLRLTLSDGQVINCGQVLGKDGKNGRDGLNGKDGKDAPPGKDGRPGRDGLDGRDGTHVEINDAGPARLDVSDIKNLRWAELVIDGEITRVLTL